MDDNKQKIAILQVLDINIWCGEQSQQSKNHQKTLVAQHQVIGVFLSSADQKSLIKPFLEAMFFNEKHEEIKYYDAASVDVQKKIALHSIIIYDYSLNLEIVKDNQYAGRLLFIPIDQLTNAVTKKEMMMEAYAISNFTP